MPGSLTWPGVSEDRYWFDCVFLFYIHQGCLQDVNTCMFSFSSTGFIDFEALTWQTGWLSVMIGHHASCRVLSLLHVCSPSWHAIASRSTTCRKKCPTCVSTYFNYSVLYNSLKNVHLKITLHGWHLFFKGQVKVEYLQCLINNCSLKMSLGCGGIAPHSHEFSCGWRGMVSFIPWLTGLCLWKLPISIGLEAKSVHAPAGAWRL